VVLFDFLGWGKIDVGRKNQELKANFDDGKVNFFSQKISGLKDNT